MFEFSIKKLIRNLLPWFLRTPIMQAILETYLHPVQESYDSFLVLKTDRLYFSNVTGQVISLEYMLNKIFYGDGTLHRIFIEDSEQRIHQYLFNKLENQPLYCYNKLEMHDPIYLHNQPEYQGAGFIVNVPVELNFDYHYMRSLIEENKASGFVFEIKTY